MKLDELVRVEGGRITAVLTRATGDLDLAEDAVQDAVVAALEVWPHTGVPHDPAAWLYVAARRKALDVIRREGRRADKEAASAGRPLLDREPPEPSVIRDDQLRLIFTCCHPALDLDARVALALRTLCGLSTAEVARRLLTTEPTMAKRLVRAKNKIKTAGIPYRVPEARDLPARLAGVCAVVHLVYTSGHATDTGAAQSNEAIRLARLLVDLIPDDPMPEALLALLLLTEARRPARLDENGDLVPLQDQDRVRWDRSMIDEGIALLQRSLARTDGEADPYQLQAAIAASHAAAPSYESTDWPEVARLYRLLADVYPNPVVDLNLAVAVGEADGAPAALALLDDIPLAAQSYLWHAARAEMLERIDRSTDAASEFRLAACAAPTDAERRHLTKRADRLDSTRTSRSDGSP